jgi:hypothetical protein
MTSNRIAIVAAIFALIGVAWYNAPTYVTVQGYKLIDSGDRQSR